MNARNTRAARSLRIAFACLLAAIAANAHALEVPSWTGPVNDTAEVMTADEKASLAEYLSAVNSQTGVQVGVLTVPSLDGDTMESFSMRVADEWKLGSAEKDNGAVLIVSIADRDLRIEVGYGLEETLTDMKCGLIIRNVIIPEFKSGNYGAGIVAGAKSVVGVATGEITIEDEGAAEASGASSDAGGVGMIFVFILFFILRIATLGRRRGLGGILGPVILGSALSNMNRNSGSGWSSRSSGFGGGGGGGGFSGGGGGFGGGGASGHW